MRGGIRLRITALAMAVVAVVLIITSVALLASQRRILTNNLDEVLRNNSLTIERDYTTGQLASVVGGQGDEDAVVQVVDADGRILASTANFGSEPALPSPAVGRSMVRTVHLPTDESRYRLLSRSVEGVVIHTATPIDDVEESVSALRRGLLVTTPAVAIVIGLLVWWLVGRTLRPVELIRAQVAEISGANLDRRVSEPATGDEIARLANTMNAMLARLEAASARERRLVADASHELRSPLARMRTELEVDLSHPQAADLTATHRSVLEEVDNLTRLVNDLLHLARSDASESDALADRMEHVPIAIDELVLAEAELMRAGTDASIETSCESGAVVRGDPRQIARAVRNVCDNAARHASSRIDLSTRYDGGVVEVAVTDDGPGIPMSERRRVFERFARLDDSRQSASGGAGLGLAIARDIVRRHGGTIGIEGPEGAGSTFVISLPADS